MVLLVATQKKKRERSLMLVRDMFLRRLFRFSRRLLFCSSLVAGVEM